MDHLLISNLEVLTHIGVPDRERAKAQRLLISVSLALSTKSAAKTDDVKKSINYWDLAEDIRVLAKTERKTIERFAEDVATLTRKTYKPKSVTVSVTKFPLPYAGSVTVTITRP